jgi:hypothetical protein
MINGDPVTTELAQAGHNLRVARDKLGYAKNDAQAAAKAAVKAGESEVYVAEMLGVTRVTVRKWIGK